MNYTKEQTEYVLSEYKKDPTRETVDRLGEELSESCLEKAYIEK
jgi:hypothetical protein